jgi:hypothetical protein
MSLGRLTIIWRAGPWRFDWAAGRSVGFFTARAMPDDEWRVLVLGRLMIDWNCLVEGARYVHCPACIVRGRLGR